MAGFDSKLVRLKGINQEHSPRIPSLVFRFQTGSIKSEVRDLREDHRKTFRFQTGSIKSVHNLLTLRILGTFRFQTGSIKSCVPFW